MKLTALDPKNAKPCDKPFKLTDGAGLYLLVQPSGSKLWRMDYRYAGRRRTLALGAFPEVGLAKARAGRDEARQLLRDGKDPVAARKEAELRRRLALESTFAMVADAYRAKRVKEGLGGAAARKDREMLALATAEFGRAPIGQVRPHDVLTVIRRHERRGKSAVRLRSTISRVFRYGIACGLCETDPAAALVDAVIKKPTRHHPSPKSPAKIGALVRAARGYEGQLETRIALQLGILLFVRPNELRKAEWSEIDPAARQWRIPAAKMKMRRDHIVPLSRQAWALIEELRTITGNAPYLFPSIRTPLRPMSENTINAALRRLDYSKDEVVHHGFRSMASTTLNESGRFQPDWIERQLSHVEGNQSRAAYNAAQWLPQRTEMMQWWADWLDQQARIAELL